MSKASFPVWYPFRELKKDDLDLSNMNSEDHWKKLILDRISIFGINGDKNFRKEEFESVQEFKERGGIDVLSHRLLITGVCLNPRMTNWLLENEGDLLQYRFSKISWNQMKSILDDLYDNDGVSQNWMELSDLSLFLDEDIQKKFHLYERSGINRMTKTGSKFRAPSIEGFTKYVAIDFRYASFLIKHRRALLYKGWVIGTVEKLLTTIKHRFEFKLGKIINKEGEEIENGTKANRRKRNIDFAEIIGQLTQQSKEFKMDGVTLSGNFDDHLNYYPPCIAELVNEVETKGYIAHWERFQLGLFLKHTGMEIEEQLQYWFSKAVDNIGMTFDQFKKRAGYVIKHIYGLEGGKIDYEMPSCVTIQNKMYCTFRHKDPSLIEEQLIKTFNLEEKPDKVANMLIKEIVDQSSRGFPSEACASYLTLKTKTVVGNRKNKIFHPMFYLKMAAKTAGIYKESTEVIEGKENTDKVENKTDGIKNNFKS